MADLANRASFGGGDVLTHEDLEKEQALEEIESGAEFRQLERAKQRFIVPATIFFMVYCLALPVLVGFFGTNADGSPGFMDYRLFTGFSIAYLFALSQFIMAWILAFIYLRAFAPRIDGMVKAIVDRVARRNENGGR